MFIIEYTTPAPNISAGLSLDLDLGLTVTTIDRSQNGLILIEGTSVLAAGGQLDIADLAGRSGQPMLIEAFSIVSADPLGITLQGGVMGPLDPGNTDNSDRELAGVVIAVVNAPGLFDFPILIPSLHRWGMSALTGPFRIILQCRELQAGDLENDWVQSQLVA